MVDWTKAMQQTFEYYIVDPGTWRDARKIDTVISSSITRDLNTETLGSATIDMTQSLDECYIRIYLITIQNGIREKHPLGVYLFQTPSYNFDGKIRSVSMDGYTPLIELKENLPPLGYSVSKGETISEIAYRIMREQIRAPISKSSNTETLHSNFVASLEDTWVTFIRDLLSNAKMHLDLDELGRVIFSPERDTASLQPVWTFDDSNSSILYPSLDVERDLYGIPNVVEVMYSNGVGYFHGIAINNDPNSPVSTVSRGRRITKRITNPGLPGNPTQEHIQEYAERTLKELSTLEYSISYTHGYCPVRIGDCVRLNYEKAGLIDIKAKVVSQSINCTPGCPVTEKAVFTSNLWGSD